LKTLIFVGEGDAVLGATRAGQNGWEGSISQRKEHFPDGARTHDQEEEEVIPSRAA
jgi:hypothetical protein